MELATLPDFFYLHYYSAYVAVIASFLLGVWIIFQIYRFVGLFLETFFKPILEYISNNAFLAIIFTILGIFLFFILILSLADLLDRNQKIFFPKDCLLIKQQAGIYNYYRSEIFGKCEWEDSFDYIGDRYDDYESCKIDNIPDTKYIDKKEIEFLLDHNETEMRQWFPSVCGSFEDNNSPF
tara:strand:- start:132 stop:674 length:543 start_codon:yes stop_codon:yes gene_type:complete